MLFSGVIYGDISTSPLYVYSATFTSQPSVEDVEGVASTIFWVRPSLPKGGVIFCSSNTPGPCPAL